MKNLDISELVVRECHTDTTAISNACRPIWKKTYV